MADDADYAQEYQAKQIAAALANRRKISTESLTHCRDCGDRIPKKRRLASPGCTLCIDCQSALERR